jgi:hypothetical protein
MKNSKKGIIDQIMLWLVIFISFVIIFVMVTDYYVVVKFKDRTDTMANYGVRMKALGREDTNITVGLNNLKSDSIDDIVEDDLICTEDDTLENYQVKFSINLDINTTTFKNKSIHSYTSAFNEVNKSSIDCNLTLRVKEE